ncbi:hypothetical protein [Aliiglaciecola aliphaticivorans]
MSIPINIKAIAKNIALNRLNGVSVSSADYPLGTEDPYTIQTMVTSYLPPMAAWKAGGTNQKTQKYFSVKTAYFGPIPDEVVFTGKNIELNSKQIHFPLKGEVEVCFRTNEEVQELTLNSTTEQIVSSIESVHLCLELPWTQFKQPSSGVEYLIADLCGANALLVGPGLPFSKWSESEDELRLTTDSKTLTKGYVLESIIKPLRCYLEFIQICLKNNIALEKNIYLATGGVTECVELPANGAVQVISNKLPDFSVNII